MDTHNFDSLWDYSDPGATAIKFGELLPAAEASGDKSYYAQLLTQIARTQSLQQKYDEAHAVLDTARRVMDGQNLPVADIRYLLERGRTFNSAGEKERAAPLFEEAYQKSAAQGEDFYAIDAAHMLGIAAAPQDRLSWNLKAVELAEKSDYKGWLGSLYNNIGWTYHGQKEYKTALDYFEKLSDLRRAQQDERGAFIARWSIARTYRSHHRIDEALVLQRELLDEIQRTGRPPSGYVFEELAECLAQKKEDAREYFRRAYEILSKDPWLRAEEAPRLQRLKDLSE